MSVMKRLLKAIAPRHMAQHKMHFMERSVFRPSICTTVVRCCRVGIFTKLANYGCCGLFCAVFYLSLIRKWAVVAFIFVRTSLFEQNSGYCVEMYYGHIFLFCFIKNVTVF